ncbi:MAG: M48 family metalloprotease [Chitinispirillales bacterium]|jgi:predicted Zn-dependent protease|nr:M48 family metalloprotease [Chitinispirillales bacterium]
MNPFFICLFLIVPLLLAGCASAIRNSGEDSAWIKLEEIDNDSLLVLSRSVEQRLENHNLLFVDDELEQYLDEILSRLASPHEKQRHNLKIKVLRSRRINAFAYPHGTIFVSVPLLARITNEGQLAAVLSHELIHIVNNHAEKNLIKLKERSGAQIQPHPDLVFLFGEGRHAGSAAAVLSASLRGYSRELEREADSLGVFKMAAAGYPHDEFLGLFLLLRDYVVTENVAEIPFFNSHPRITERIRNYHNIINNSKLEKSDGDKNEEVFKTRVKNAVLYDARINTAAGRADLAEAQLDRVLSIEVCNAEALIMRGDLERHLSPRSTAFFLWYESALQCDSDNTGALRALGYGYHSIGNFEKAREYLSKYSELAPDAADIKMAEETLRRCF